eukprot:TRINITY_DN6169_c0_g1_i1.p1 TRINITY_DN6169_c0_g1~~TRINITY_DN6169_c0_g1_i1.p1  ORF type:complete len:677 (-),score=106.19 TRINITY_DN6169_c0_g1_i1:60-2090(-)
MLNQTRLTYITLGLFLFYLVFPIFISDSVDPPTAKNSKPRIEQVDGEIKVVFFPSRANKVGDMRVFNVISDVEDPSSTDDLSITKTFNTGRSLAQGHVFIDPDTSIYNMEIYYKSSLAAGYLEGFLLSDYIWETYNHFYDAAINLHGLNIIEQTLNYLEEQGNIIKSSLDVKNEDDQEEPLIYDNDSKEILSIMQQLVGLLHGYNRYSNPSRKLEMKHILFLNIIDELDDVVVVVKLLNSESTSSVRNKEPKENLFFDEYEVSEGEENENGDRPYQQEKQYKKKMKRSKRSKINYIYDQKSEYEIEEEELMEKEEDINDTYAMSSYDNITEGDVARELSTIPVKNIYEKSFINLFNAGSSYALKLNRFTENTELMNSFTIGHIKWLPVRSDLRIKKVYHVGKQDSVSRINKIKFVGFPGQLYSLDTITTTSRNLIITSSKYSQFQDVNFHDIKFNKYGEKILKKLVKLHTQQQSVYTFAFIRGLIATKITHTPEDWVLAFLGSSESAPLTGLGQYTIIKFNSNSEIEEILTIEQGYERTERLHHKKNLAVEDESSATTNVNNVSIISTITPCTQTLKKDIFHSFEPFKKSKKIRSLLFERTTSFTPECTTDGVKYFNSNNVDQITTVEDGESSEFVELLVKSLNEDLEIRSLIMLLRAIHRGKQIRPIVTVTSWVY